VEKIKRRILYSITFFPKIASFMRSCRKIWFSQRSHQWRHNMAHRRCTLRKQGYTCARACIRLRSREPPPPHTHTHAHTHARTHTRTHTHTEKCVILLFHCNNGFVKALVLPYTYMACLFVYILRVPVDKATVRHLDCNLWRNKYHTHFTSVIPSTLNFEKRITYFKPLVGALEQFHNN
jgi:hypothetical protein